MLRSRFTHGKFRVGAFAVGALLTTATPAWSAAKRVCMPPYAAYKSAQEREQAGHVREARELYQSCAQQDAAVTTACAGVVQKCKVKVEQLSSALPTVIPVVTDESGAPRADVQVKVDGTLLTSQLDGKGLSVEPGIHEFTFATDKGVFATEKVMIIEGQRNRPISASMGGRMATAAPVASPPSVEPKGPVDSSSAAAEKTSDHPGSDNPSPPAEPPEETPVASAPPAHPRGRSVVPYLLGGVGVLGLGAGALLTYWGKKDNDDMVAQCGVSRTCPPGSVDHIRNLYLASDIAIGAGAAALGVGVVLFATSGSRDTRPATRSAHFDVQPTRSGALASVSGAF